MSKVFRPLPGIALAVLSPLLVAVSTVALLWVQRLMMDDDGKIPHHPYGIGFLVPVGLLTVLGGRRGGFLTLVLALASTLCVLTPRGVSVSSLHTRDWVELFFLLSVGTALVIGLGAVQNNALLHRQSREARERLSTAEAELRESERRRVSFSREVLLAATGGRLDLCEPEELHARVEGEAVVTAELTEHGDVSRLRHELHLLLSRKGLGELRADDLAMCITEAGTNAVKHGGGGIAQVWLREGEGQEAVVLIRDQGPGISSVNLARATLERGFSTQVSLGMGFCLMMESADSLALSTSPEGTLILFRVGGHPRRSVEESVLASFGAVGALKAF